MEDQQEQQEEKTKITEASKIVETARITICEQAYYRLPEDNPILIDRRFVRFLKTDEQLYVRKCSATEEREPLDFGWVKHPGLIIILNKATPPRQTSPTEAEAKLITEKVLQLSFSSSLIDNDHCLLIPPGESLRIETLSPGDLLIRSKVGKTKYTIYVFPE